METILQAKDAADWVYKGEGAANLVLAYSGSSPALVGKVIRVKKLPKSESQSTVSNLVLSEYERLIWRVIEELVASSSKELAGQLYVLHIMSPLLGSQFVDVGVRVLVSQDFLELVDKNVHNHRPAWRVDASKVDTLCDSALLMSDHSVFPRGSLEEDLCIAVEIKPKCGFLPFSRFIAEGNAIKKSISRFRMLQNLKLHHREVSRISEYDPLDLFSGSGDRINHAMKALFAIPQNNFRIFLNGSLIYGDSVGSMDDVECAVDQKHTANNAFEDLLKGVIRADCGARLGCLLELVGETIFRSEILERLLEVQKLDKFDIEGAIHAYYNIISQPCLVCKSLGELSHMYSYLHSLSLEESMEIVRDYLIAATAKDCSLMISLKPRLEGNLVSEHSSIYLESANQVFDYKACFVDLDMKPLRKMVQHYELDQKIVSFYTEMKSKKDNIV